MAGVSIKGIGISTPSKLVKSVDIDQYLGIKLGTTELKTGINSRYYVKNETAGELGVESINNALKDANLKISDIDCIISAAGTMEQAIPYNAANLHRLLKLKHPIPSFDVNMTCLSAVAAIDVANALILNNTYNNILIVSSEIASVGIDWNDKETGGMFGDGAAAFVLGQTNLTSKRLIASHFETHSEGYESCQILGGGSLNHPAKVESKDYTDYGMFKMNGKDAYRITAKVMPKFLKALLQKANISLSEIDWVVPHQASHLGLTHLQKKLSIPSGKLINILNKNGNQIAASIPTAMYELLKNKPIRNGDKVLIIGTSAGISLGGIILEV